MKKSKRTLLVVGNQGLGDGLTDGVHLCSVTGTGNADADVNVCEAALAQQKDGLVDLQNN